MERLQGKSYMTRSEEKIVRMFAEVEEVIKSTFESSEKMKEYLDFRTRIPNYSVHNMTMIKSQSPDAHMVGSVPYWNNRGVYVRSGEHGIAILVPQNQRGNGNVQFKIGYVFDIQQINADEEKKRELLLAEDTKLLKEDDYDKLFEAVSASAEENNVRIELSADKAGTWGGRVYPRDNVIVLRPDNPILQHAEAAMTIKMLSYILLARKEKWTSKEKLLQSEIIQYMVYRHYDLNTAEINFQNLDEAEIQEMNTATKKKLLEDAFEVAEKLIKGMDQHLSEKRAQESVMAEPERVKFSSLRHEVSETEEKRGKPLERATGNEKRIVDFGKKIGGARKDLWKERGLDIEDIEEMNEGETAKYIVKDNIWKKPDYMSMIQEGTSIRAAYFIKEVRNALPAKVIYSYEDTTKEKIRQRQEDYINLIRDVKEQLLKVKNDRDICSFFDNFVNSGVYVEREGTYSLKKKEKGFAVTNKMLRAMQINAARLSVLDRKIKDEQFGVPAENKLPKGYTIRYLKEQQEYLVLKAHRIIAEGIKSEQEAIEKARELQKYAISSRKKRFIPKQLENIRRDGPSNGITSEHPADGEMYLEKFGFRGGEFGNWMSEADRQASLNMGYDALCDLATALEIDQAEISFGNRLSVAFGARGQGGKCSSTL